MMKEYHSSMFQTWKTNALEE